MAKLARLTFIALDGDAPASALLDVIPSSEAVFSLVRSVFSPFCAENADIRSWDGSDVVAAPTEGFHLVYAYGHAWLNGGVPQVAWRCSTGSVMSDGPAAVASWIDPMAAPRTVLILDCCHAAAFDAYLTATSIPLITVYASAADESAIAFGAEEASRLSLGLAAELSHGVNLDLVNSVANVATKLDRDSVVTGQTVTYRMSGSALRLTRSSKSTDVRRENTVSRVRRRLLAAGAVVTALLLALIWYYWSHVLVEIDLAGLPQVAHDIKVTCLQESPDTNGSVVVAAEAVNGGRARMWVPAGDIRLRVDATYVDEAPRGLNFHLLLRRSFDPREKLLPIALPLAGAVIDHPNMAYVPVEDWFHGRERAPQRSSGAFWIDIRPPTVNEYDVVARKLLDAHALKSDNSFVLTARQRSAAIDATGLGQVRSLNKSLGESFGIVAAAASQHVEAPGDIVAGAGALPCDECPAPMTRMEAGLYCESRHMRLPTDLEWELAVRGVDGRVYPWGNQFDASRANVPGLPEKGAPSPALKPVLAYPKEFSPFGLLDTVGNAGDWVTNASGSYERVYMGATYRFNPEDATAFRMLPVTDDDAFVREITARCAVNARE